MSGDAEWPKVADAVIEAQKTLVGDIAKVWHVSVFLQLFDDLSVTELA